MAEPPSHRSRSTGLLWFTALAVALSACGGSTAGRSSNPFATAGFVAVSGGAPGAISPGGIAIRFVADGRFGLAFALRNGTHEQVTVLNAQTPEPADSLVHQTGALLGHWSPPRCPRGAVGCPLRVFLVAPFGPARPTPITIGPGKMVGVQLNYGLVGCSDSATSSTSSARSLEISYRYRNGAIRSQKLPLAAIQLRLQRPAASECLRQHSRIVIEGPYATSSADAVAGGYGLDGGDTCLRTRGGGLEFRSAPLQSRRDGKPQLTVHVQIPQLYSRGTYGSPTAAGVRGAARVDITTDTSGESTFPPELSRVTVTQANTPVFSGRLDAVVTAYRTSFRLYGDWHCTTSK